jgi:VWFA-related protein
MPHATVRPARLAARALLSAALLLASAVAAAAQEPRPEPTDDVIRVESNLMQAGVTVLDKQGRFVEGLTAEQFELLVDGKPQPIAFLEQVAAGRPEERAKLAAAGDPNARAATRPGEAPPPPQGRTVIFFLDDIHMPVESINRTQKLLRHFVEKEMGEDDLAAVTTASGQLGFLQQVTGNRDVLRAAVTRLRPWPQAGTDGQVPLMTEYIARAIAVEYDRDVMETYIQVLVRDGVNRRAAEALVRTRAQAILLRANNDTRNSLRSLASTVRAVSPLPGRKLVFFLSDGFLLSRHDSDITDALREITDGAVRAGIVLYTLDSRGLATDAYLDASAGAGPPDPGGAIARKQVSEMTASQEALHILAEETGGRALLNTNAQVSALSRTINETAAYYLLAWRPEGEQKAGKFRRLQVNVKGRPELVVLMQRGFLEEEAGVAARRGGGKEKPVKRGEELNTALAAAVPVRNLPAHLEVAYSLDEKGEAVLTALVSVPEDALGRDATGARAVEVAGYVVNLDGKIGSRFGERLNIRDAQMVAAAAGPDGRGHVLYRHQLKLTPGLYQVRAAAWDANSGRAGSAAEWVEIPDLKSGRLTAGSLLVGERPTETGQPQDAGNFVLQRSAERRLARAAHLRFMTYIYNAARGPNGPDLEAQIEVLRGGKAVIKYDSLKVEAAAADARAVAYGGEFALATLAPGRYTLRLNITDRVSQSKVTSRAFFSVE